MKTPYSTAIRKTKLSSMKDLSGIYCYESIPFSISFNNKEFTVMDHKRDIVVEIVNLDEEFPLIAYSELDIEKIFEDLKTKYILNHEGIL